MALSVVTSWLHLRSSSSVEEQEVWGVDEDVNKESI